MIIVLIVCASLGVGYGIARVVDGMRWSSVEVTARPANAIHQPEEHFTIRVPHNYRRWLLRIIRNGMRETGFSGGLQWVEHNDHGDTLTGTAINGRKQSTWGDDE